MGYDLNKIYIFAFIYFNFDVNVFYYYYYYFFFPVWVYLIFYCYYTIPFDLGSFFHLSWLLNILVNFQQIVFLFFFWGPEGGGGWLVQISFFFFFSIDKAIDTFEVLYNGVFDYSLSGHCLKVFLEMHLIFRINYFFKLSLN